jgi:hypothetical protein
MTPSPEARARAEETVATHFTRTMNAATSRWGILTDLTLMSAISAVPIVLVVRQAGADELFSPLSYALLGIAFAPIALSVAVGIALRDARERVVDWLAAQPFPVENVNAILVGLTDEMEVVFDRSKPRKMPTREEVQRRLEALSPDALATAADPKEMRLELKVGVVESKRLPLQSAHARWRMFQRIVEEVLVPMHREHPIVHVRISLGRARVLGRAAARVLRPPRDRRGIARVGPAREADRPFRDLPGGGEAGVREHGGELPQGSGAAARVRP